MIAWTKRRPKHLFSELRIQLVHVLRIVSLGYYMIYLFGLKLRFEESHILLQVIDLTL